jgi:pyridoxal phosphate enzyme (YggS family)
MLSKEEIQNNIKTVEQKIQAACDRVGRENNVKLIAVTKTFPEALLSKCLALGITTIGENRAREMRDKYETFGDQFEWHMIGHSQRNKVKYVIDKATLIHSLDSIRLAKEINKRAAKEDKIMDCLIQINAVDEDSKYGFLPKDIDDVVEAIAQLSNIRIVGLMNMAPFFDDAEKTRPGFKKMKEIFDSLKDCNYDNIHMNHLSMGMSNDYEIAVEEGSTMVRIGSSIFGARDYS